MARVLTRWSFMSLINKPSNIECTASLVKQLSCDCEAVTQAPRGRNNFEPRSTGGVLFVKGMFGHTMIELLLAIVVTAMVSTVVFAAYLGIQKQFKKNQDNAEVVFQMINAKNKLKSIFGEIYEVEEIYSNKVYYRTIDSKTQNVISYSGNVISQNRKTIISDINSLELEITSEKDNSAVLLYSAHSNKNGWIGGSVKVFIR